MTEQERELVIKYLDSQGIDWPVCALYGDVEKTISKTYYSREYAKYSMNLVFNEIWSDFKSELYRKWINTVIKIIRLWQK